ncbi:glycine cleavage system aminomethyltransferase GcvT [Mechercharimyces sp. CAU 1602]|uniref:glycine cleavage system aminomethyltransferase GcvT n=1 Tax=Mechercharimyces sp. CAU 1602 TaxID=2973933 RepID=UPI002162B12D|nr:glycine cleavage system aminomethyltransferase GcvT [Mechercharimyces sp. CAU 1602]MCS1350713.1 glycine cleavage system aminomethyltransferase GcvT [Mechercharimyces sp. CAU 1602]
MTQLKQTPLFEVYREDGKIVPFAGWELPVRFAGIKDEHEAVRMRAGLFDVSHMGEVEVRGPDAFSLVQKLTTNDVSKLEPGKIQYTLMCYPDGGTVDDLLVYQQQKDCYLLVINAANIEKDVEWIEKHAVGDVEINNISDEVAQLALQGPKAQSVLQSLTEIDLDDIRFFRFQEDVVVSGVKALVSRTGYTGEDGFELYLSAQDAPTLWKALMHAGAEPCGLGARDTLRFEARLPLYGNELSPHITPLEVGLGFAVKLKQEDDFIGKESLQRMKDEGLPRKLVGIEMVERGIPRTGYAVFSGEREIGKVTSGTQSPTLKKNVGLALLDSTYADEGNEVEVEIRGKRIKATIVATPFYKRPQK